MNSATKNFIERNIELIECHKIEELYDKLVFEPLKYLVTPQLTKTLEDIDIEPLEYLDYVPEYYMSHREDIDYVDIHDHRIIEFEAFAQSCVKDLRVHNKCYQLHTRAFAECSQLHSVILGDSVIQIHSGAFYGCDNLTSVYIAGSVRYIGDYAFSECSRLRSIRYGGTIEEWNRIDIVGMRAFDNILINCSDGTISFAQQKGKYAF